MENINIANSLMREFYLFENKLMKAAAAIRETEDLADVRDVTECVRELLLELISEANLNEVNQHLSDTKAA